MFIVFSVRKTKIVESIDADNEIPVYQTANKITSFTTGSGVQVEIYNHSGTTIVVATKNGVPSVSIK
jgi:hypothetical protein